MLGFMAATRRVRPRRAGLWRALFLLALLNTALPFSLFAYAQTQIASGLASILNATTPLWGVIVAHLFTPDEKATPAKLVGVGAGIAGVAVMIGRSEEHTSELQSLMRISYAVFCLKKKKTQ